MSRAKSKKGERSQLYEKIVQLKMEAHDGKMRDTDTANTKQAAHINFHHALLIRSEQGRNNEMV